MAEHSDNAEYSEHAEHADTQHAEDEIPGRPSTAHRLGGAMREAAGRAGGDIDLAVEGRQERTGESEPVARGHVEDKVRADGFEPGAESYASEDLDRLIDRSDPDA